MNSKSIYGIYFIMATFCINNVYLHPGEKTSEGQNLADYNHFSQKPLSRNTVRSSHKILTESKKLTIKTREIVINGIHRVQTRFKKKNQIQLTWHN